MIKEKHRKRTTKKEKEIKGTPPRRRTE